MKKKTLQLLTVFFFFFSSAIAQRSINAWGTWGYGVIENQKDITKYIPFGIKGFNVNISWSDIEPQDNQYNWAPLDQAIQLLKANDLWVGIMILYGQNCPEWIFNKVPQVYTEGGQDTGPYPYYFDKDYKKAYYDILNEIAKHIDAYDNQTKSYIAYWQIAEGSTGDTGPWKGEPVDEQYEISPEDWSKFRRATWDSVAAYTQGRNYKLLFNAGNDGEYLDYVEEHFPEDMNKDGKLSHEYSFNGETVYFTRQISTIHEKLFNYRSRGEAQAFWNYPWWQLAPLKQSFTMICSAAAGGLDMFNIPGGWITQNINDPRPTDFFNQYGGRRTATLSTRGFIALRDVFDFNDIERFPTKEYGPVIAPANQNDFEKSKEKLRDDTTIGSTYRYWLISQNIARFMNPSRVKNITDEMEGQGAMYNTQGDQYHNDFGIGVAQNHAKFIAQLRANETSIGRFRLGPDSSMYGRYSREFIIQNGKGAMYFKLNEDLLNVGGNRINLEVTVTYFDDGNGVWKILAGEDLKKKVTNTGTNRWKRITVTFNNFVPGTLLDNTADIGLQYVSGDNTAFTLIEVVNLDKERELSVTVNTAFSSNIAEQIKDAGSDERFEIYPNPSQGKITVAYNNGNAGSVQLKVFDNTGKQVFSKQEAATKGNNTYQLNLSHLASGMYYLELNNGNRQHKVKFVIGK